MILKTKKKSRIYKNESRFKKIRKNHYLNITSLDFEKTRATADTTPITAKTPSGNSGITLVPMISISSVASGIGTVRVGLSPSYDTA